MSWRILQGDALTVLRTLPDESVHCVVTSPSYFGLRDYGTARWEGGDSACDHKRETRHQQQGATSARIGRANTEAQRNENFRNTCGKCGARRIDQQIGLEKLHDCQGWATGSRCGECYVCRLTAVFGEVRRVLREDGVCFVVIGDSYSGYHGNSKVPDENAPSNKPGYIENMRGTTAGINGLKPKDLCMIPQRLALSLQADGWWVRDLIV